MLGFLRGGQQGCMFLQCGAQEASTPAYLTVSRPLSSLLLPDADAHVSFLLSVSGLPLLPPLPPLTKVNIKELFKDFHILCEFFVEHVRFTYFWIYFHFNYGHMCASLGMHV